MSGCGRRSSTRNSSRNCWRSRKCCCRELALASTKAFMASRCLSSKSRSCASDEKSDGRPPGGDAGMRCSNLGGAIQVRYTNPVRTKRLSRNDRVKSTQGRRAVMSDQVPVAEQVGQLTWRVGAGNHGDLLLVSVGITKAAAHQKTADRNDRPRRSHGRRTESLTPASRKQRGYKQESQKAA